MEGARYDRGSEGVWHDRVAYGRVWVGAPVWGKALIHSEQVELLSLSDAHDRQRQTEGSLAA